MQGGKVRKSGEGLVVVYILDSVDFLLAVELGVIAKRHFHIPCSPYLGKANGEWGLSCELGLMRSIRAFKSSQS